MTASHTVDASELWRMAASPGFWLDLGAGLTEATTATRTGTAVAAPRQIVRTSTGNGLGVMAGIVEARGDVHMGVKLVALPRIRDAHGPSHPGSVVLIDLHTGTPRFTFDAHAVTALRTAAMTAAVSRRLYPVPGQVLVVGTGAEAFTHLCALHAVYPQAELQVWGRSPHHLDALIGRLPPSVGEAVHKVTDLAAALATADTITSVTSAAEPFLDGRDVSRDVHINAVGASVQGLAEWTPRTFDGAQLIVCDDVEECGRQSSEISGEQLDGALGVADLFQSPQVEERDSALGVTIYKSVGSAVMDITAAGFLAAAVRPAMRT